MVITQLNLCIRSVEASSKVDNSKETLDKVQVSVMGDVNENH